MAYTTATLTGTYKTFDNQPASGVVEIIPNSRSLVDSAGNVILAGRVKVELDAAGSFTVTLPATDDPTVEPATGRQYTVVAKLRHTHLPAVTGVELASGATVDVADVSSRPSTDALVSPAATLAQVEALEADVAAHKARTDNPHAVTKAQVGLGSVDNVSAASLRDRATHTGTQPAASITGLAPVATSGTYASLTGKPTIPSTPGEVGADPAGSAAAAEAAAKAASTPVAHATDTTNPHAVTKAQVGLGNVDNTSDANKPISTATQTALNAKQDAATLDADVAAEIDTPGSATSAALSASYAGVPMPGTPGVAVTTGDVAARTRREAFDLTSDATGGIAGVFIQNHGDLRYGLAITSGGSNYNAIYINYSNAADLDYGIGIDVGANANGGLLIACDGGATAIRVGGSSFALEEWKDGSGASRMRVNTINGLLEFASNTSTRWYSDGYGTSVAEVTVNGTDAGLANFWNRGVRTRMTTGAPANGYSGEIAVEAGKLWVHDGTGWKSVAVA